MEILVLIDKLDDLIHNARPVPLTDQVRLDAKPLYDILDQMRANLPQEILQARVALDASRNENPALKAAVSAAIQENIPAIAQATAAAIGGARPPQPPGGPF